MTLGEVKERVLKLLDESKPKNDLTEKIPLFVDAGQKEVSIYCPIVQAEQFLAEDELPTMCRKVIRVEDEDGVPVEYRVIMDENGKRLAADSYPCTLLYEKIPRDITVDSADETKLEISEKAALAVIFYAAAQCNSMEYDQRFFQSFYAQYQGKLQNLTADAGGAAMAVVQDGSLPDWM